MFSLIILFNFIVFVVFWKYESVRGYGFYGICIGVEFIVIRFYLIYFLKVGEMIFFF